MKRVSVFVFFCFFCVRLFAQSYIVSLHSVDGKDDLLNELQKKPSQFTSDIAVYSFIRELVPTLQAQGYLAASVDSIIVSDGRYNIYVYLGDSYKWAKVDLDSLPLEILLQNGFNKWQWQGKNLDPKLISRISEKTLEWAEQHGYPFASVWLEVALAENSSDISAKFRWKKGAEQKLDSINIEGDVKVSRNYLLRYLDLEQGEFYNEKKLRTISGRLRDLAFLQESRPWRMDFSISDNQLNIYIKEKKANNLSAIVGLLPNSIETGKFLLTADAAFLFQNILGSGEYINIVYQNLQYKSPRFKANVAYPYLFNTPVGLDATFDLFKKDTTFRRTTFQGGARYYLNATDFIRVFYQNQSNRLGVIDTNYIKTNKQLPADADVTAKGAGIEFTISRVDNRMIPTKGFDVKIGGTVLRREVRKADEVLRLHDASGFDYASLYDSVSQRNNQLFLNASMNYYLALTKSIILKTGYNGAYMEGGNLFRNELYQIGGFRLLRGFDEQSIFSNQYHVATIELRLLLDRNSYFYFFTDNAWVQSNFSGLKKDDIYNGFGIGATLETKTGLFSISYAVGRHEGNPIQLRQSKIHFGYAAFF